MKIGVVNRNNREGNTGFTSFEEGVIPYLLEDERFESIDYTFHGGIRAITSELYLGRKVKKADKENDYDVIFVPTHAQMMNINPDKLDAKIVPYIHDMLVLSTPYYNFIYNLKGRLWIRNVKKCDFLFSASKFTEDELKNRAAYKGESEVVYQGAGFEPTEDSNKYGEREYDILYVGEMRDRKDPETLRKVAKMAEKENLKMIAVNREELDLECETKADVSNEELKEIYSNTKYYLHPSFVEGFGRCPVEAQSRGAVPIALDTEINNEILADAFIEFEEPEDVIETVQNLSQDEWQEYSEASIENSKRFNFEETREKIKQKLVELAE